MNINTNSHVVHIEITRKTRSSFLRADVETLVRQAFEKKGYDFLVDTFVFRDFISIHSELLSHVQNIRIHVETKSVLKRNKNALSMKIQGIQNSESLLNGNCSDSDADSSTRDSEVIPDPINGHESIILKYYVYELDETGEEAEYMDDDDDSDQSAASHHWILPSASFDGLWDSLIFDDEVQTRLLKYIDSALLFSEKGVDSNLISWNKVILLHGPPGTGKTSLCKALAQKATIRLISRYSYGQLIEINSHSLFSKWFSESGKLVMKMFEKIHDLVQDPKSLVFLLIDEVESLAQCRQSAEAGNEPSDSIRAVNALLTQIDRVKMFPNVVILTTSNIVGSIDLAFVDRADLKICIGPPPTEIIFRILASSINELIRVGIIKSTFVFDSTLAKESSDSNVEKLFRISRMANGMSGRTLRKIPFLTFANFVRGESNLEEFIEGLEKAIELELSEAKALKHKSKSDN